MSESLMESSASLERLVQDSLAESWELFKNDGVLFVVSNLIVTACSVVTLGVLFAPLNVGLIDIVRRRRRGESAGIGDVFGGLSSFGTSFVALLMLGFVAIFAFLLLVLPGLLWLLVTAFTFQVIAYKKDIGAVDAIKHSIALVKGHFVPVAVVMLIVFAINLVGSAGTITWLVTAPFSTILMTVAYEKLAADSARV